MLVSGGGSGEGADVVGCPSTDPPQERHCDMQGKDAGFPVRITVTS